MKLLAVGDLHYNMRQFDWVLGHSENYDGVIIAGDLLNIAGHLDLDTQIIVIKKYLQRLRERTKLIVCSGNHDGDRKSASGEFFADWLDSDALEGIFGDGTSLDLGDWHFSVCPWWDGDEGRVIVDQFLKKESELAGKNWFVIHHAPPSESRTAWSGKKDFGDTQLKQFLQSHSPRIVLSGHVHQAPFRQENGWYDKIGASWIFNAGYQMAELPPCLEFDLDGGTVRWSSLAGDEMVTLD